MLLLAVLLAICLTSIMAAWAARAIGMPGHRIIPGLLIGVLLGPVVLGRIAPDIWERVFAGGVEARAELRQLDRENTAWRLAAGTARTVADDKAKHDAQYLDAREPLVEAEHFARMKHQRPWSILTASLALFAAIVAVGCSARSRRGVSDQIIGAVSMGAWAAAVPVLGVILLAKGLGYDPFASEILILAAALAIGPWSLNPIDARIASRVVAFPGIWPCTAARTATVLGLGLVVIAATQFGLAWSVAVIAALGLARVNVTPRYRRVLRVVRNNILLPSLAAMVIIMTDVIQDARFWPILGITVLGGDGRWLGAAIGLQLRGGITSESSMRGAIVAVDTAGPQLAITAMATAMGVFSGIWITSLVCGLLVLEVSTPLRTGIEKYLRQATT